MRAVCSPGLRVGDAVLRKCRVVAAEKGGGRRDAARTDAVPYK